MKRESRETRVARNASRTKQEKRVMHVSCIRALRPSPTPASKSPFTNTNKCTFGSGSGSELCSSSPSDPESIPSGEATSGSRLSRNCAATLVARDGRWRRGRGMAVAARNDGGARREDPAVVRTGAVMK